MRCPRCQVDDDHVIDSRPAHEGTAIRRRRECNECNHRFTTYERVARSRLTVVKQDGSREPFDPEKVLSSIQNAAIKRPVSVEALETVVARIETYLAETYDKEVPSIDIGEKVMSELRGVDQVTFVRYASVYRDFKDLSEFFDDLKPLFDEGA